MTIKELGNSFKSKINKRKEDIKKAGDSGGGALTDAFFTAADYKKGDSVIVDRFWNNGNLAGNLRLATAAGTEDWQVNTKLAGIMDGIKKSTTISTNTDLVTAIGTYETSPDALITSQPLLEHIATEGTVSAIGGGTVGRDAIRAVYGRLSIQNAVSVYEKTTALKTELGADVTVLGTATVGALKTAIDTQLATPALAILVQPELEQIASEGTVSAIGGGTVGRDAIRAVLANVNSQVHKETTLHGKITALKTELGADVTVLGTATVGALKTAIDTQLATPALAILVQPELEQIASEGTVSAIGGGTVGRDAIRAVLANVNSQVHKETTLHGKITALKTELGADVTVLGTATVGALKTAIDTQLATPALADILFPFIASLKDAVNVATGGLGADVTVLGTATVGALKTAIDTQLATPALAILVQPELEQIASEGTVSAIGGGTVGRDAIRAVLANVNSQVHKETTLHGKITALKTELGADVTVLGTATVGALKTAIDTQLATPALAILVQPELEQIASEGTVSAIGGGTVGRDAIRAVLANVNSQVHKETTLHGKITALKTELGADVTVLGTATVGALKTAIDTQLATPALAILVQPELEQIASEGTVSAIGGGTVGRDAIRAVLANVNSQVHKETTLHGKITALKTELGADVTVLGTATVGALKTAIDTQLATPALAILVQPELEQIASEGTVSAIGGGTVGRDAIRAVLANVNSQVHKETTLHGKITALKYGNSKLIDGVDHFAIVDTVLTAIKTADTNHGDLLGRVFENGWDASDIFLDTNDIAARNPVDDTVIKTVATLETAAYNKFALWQTGWDAGTAPVVGTIINPRKILRAGAVTDANTQEQSVDRVNAWLTKRDEFIAANPADRVAILAELTLDRMKQLDFEGWNPEDFQWGANITAGGNSLRVINPVGDGITLCVGTIENYNGIHGANGKKALWQTGWDAGTAPVVGTIINPRKILRAGAVTDANTQEQSVDRVNAWLTKRDEFIAANPADRVAILAELTLDRMKQLDFEGWNPEDFQWGANITAGGNSLRVINPVGDGITLCVGTIENYNGIHGANGKYKLWQDGAGWDATTTAIEKNAWLDRRAYLFPKSSEAFSALGFSDIKELISVGWKASEIERDGTTGTQVKGKFLGREIKGIIELKNTKKKEFNVYLTAFRITGTPASRMLEKSVYDYYFKGVTPVPDVAKAATDAAAYNTKLANWNTDINFTAVKEVHDKFDTAAYKDATELKPIFAAAAKETEPFEAFESKEIFDKVKDILVPNLAKAKAAADTTSFADLKSVFNALKPYKNATGISDERKAWELVNYYSSTKDIATGWWDKVDGKLMVKAKAELAKEIKNYDSTKEQEMVAKMIATDYEDYEQAAEILKKLIDIKSATKAVKATVDELKKWQGTSTGNKRKGWEVLNKYEVTEGGVKKPFADYCLEKYENADKKQPDQQQKTSEAIETIIEAQDYKGQAVTAIETDLKTKLLAKKTEYPLLTNTKSAEIAKELAPRLKLRDDKELTKGAASDVQKKLAKLLSWVEIKYDGKAAADDETRFNEMNEKVTDLDLYFKPATPENKLIESWSQDDKDILQALKTKMVSRRDAMKKLREKGGEEPSGMKPLIIISIIAAGLALLWLGYYFLQGRKDEEEVEE